MTLFGMKEKLYTIQQERKSVADWLAEKATDPGIAMETINEKQKRLEELNQRIGIMEKSSSKNSSNRFSPKILGIISHSSIQLLISMPFERTAFVLSLGTTPL